MSRNGQAKHNPKKEKEERILTIYYLLACIETPLVGYIFFYIPAYSYPNCLSTVLCAMYT